MSKMNYKNYRVWGIIFSVLFFLVLVCTLIATNNPFLYNTINSVVGGERRVLVKGNVEEFQRYRADYNSKAESLSAANALNGQICDEGFVLLKNTDKALPMSKSSRVTVFGKNSISPVLGGSGSSAGTGATLSNDLYSSLRSVGIEYNPTVKEYYSDKNKSGNLRASTPAMGTNLTGYPIGESVLTEEIKTSYADDFNDVAIVVLSRIAGEGFDLPRTMFWDGSSYRNWNGTETIPGARNKTDHYLQLDANEEAMLKEACSGKFGKVVVIVNSASTMELGFLKSETGYVTSKGYTIDPNMIDACLWIGHPGESGLASVGRILVGEVNPSGRTVDTYATDFTSDPTWANFGTYMSENGNQYLRSNGKTVKAYFVEYREGIYTGYRYYETKASYDESGNWYKKNVVFPMGYGLSYTTFTQEITETAPSAGGELQSDGSVSIKVRVTNSGDVAGKDVVQVYYTAPYTEGGIEKSHVVLVGFAKTDMLEPGESQELTVEFPVRDMASYDYGDANANGFFGYELDGGSYEIKLMKNSHEIIEGRSFTVPIEGFRYAKDEVTDYEVKNVFDGVSSHIAEYLSRKDDFANWEALLGASEAEYRTINEDMISKLSWTDSDDESDPWYTEKMPTQSKKELSFNSTKIKLYELIGKSFDDKLWDELLNQLTVEQMCRLIGSGNFHTEQIDNIDKPRTIDADGPMGFAIFMGDKSVYGTGYYACECVLGSTWNVVLAYELGVMVGNEGLIGDERGDGRPYSGWYAPAMNTHRNQFAGRNFEYYGEDPLLSGKLAANVVRGAKTKGVYTYAKHFALNEQETNRDTSGLVTWADEQTMRELYLKPFEICVKEGGTTAMMSSFTRIGMTWAGGSYELLTEILRKEWGFEGMVITDYNLKDYMDTEQMIRAGGDLNLSGGKFPTKTETATDVASIRRAAHSILYTVANSNAMNGMGSGVIWRYDAPWWVIALIVTDVVIPLIALLMFFLGWKTKRGVKSES